MLAVLSLPLLDSPASAAPADGIVIDGDRAGANDWNALTAGTPGYSWYVDAFATARIGSTPAVDDDIFQSAREESAPSGWAKRMGSTDTGNDIGRTYSFNTVDSAGDVFFYLGFARQEDGVGAFAVELNKLANDSNGMPLRSTGDVRITFSQGSGNVPLTQFGADVWNTTTMQWDSVGLSAADYEGAAGENGLFAELEINLTAAGLQPPCDEGFTQVNLRSRSSAAPSSLKDYVEALTVTIVARCKRITVEKVDRTAGDAALPGASFQLFADTNKDGAFNSPGDLQVGGSQQPANQGTGSNAYTWDDLPWGTYFVKESTRPPGYDQDPGAAYDVQTVVLDADMTSDTALVTFRNPQTKAAIRVEKFNRSDNNSPLGGAKFKLYKDNGNGTFDGAPTDASVGSEVIADQGTAPNNNTYKWSDLAYGEYFVQESQAPAGFDTDPGSNNGVRSVTLLPADAGDTVDVEFFNPALVAKIKVSKFDGTTGDPLSGAKFTLYKDDGNNTFDGTGTDLPVGAEVSAGQGADDNSYTWDTGLEFGTTYFVRESVLPTGYDLDPTAGVQSTGGATNAATAAAMRTAVVSATDADSLTEVTFHNPQQTAQIQVEKKDFATLGALPGAGFTLYHDDGTDVGEWDDGDTAIGGPVPADQGAGLNTYTWSNLVWGDYLVKEITAPAGYSSDPFAENDAKLVTIEPKDAGRTVSVAFNNVKEPITPGPKSTIVITKTDVDAGGTVDGAVFELYLDDGDGVAEVGEFVDGSPTRTGVGTYKWDKLPDGDYLVKEATPPPGYLPPADDTLPVTASGGTHNVGFANAQKKSMIVLTKTDAGSGAQVDGATFVLERNGVVFSTPPVHAVGTGVYTWSGLPMGDYTVTETNPPDGYLAPDADSLPGGAVQSVDIDDTNAGETFQVGFENQRKATTPPPPPPPPTTTTPTDGSIGVTKLDADSGQRVDGATFEVYLDANSNGGVDTGDGNQGAPTRTGTGTYEWAHLPAGQYLVKEAQPPAGYLPPTSDIQAVNLAAGTTRSVEFRNSPKRTGIQVTKRDAKTNRPLDTASFQLWDDANADGRFDPAGDTRVEDRKSTVDGVVSWVGLRMGTYFVQETAAPEGYDLPANAVMTLLIDGSTAGGNLERSFYDPQKKSTIKVVKLDDVTREVLAGATFRAHLDVDRDGTVSDGDLPVGGARVTDQHGVASWSGLGFGHYVIEEVSPPAGYGLPSDTERSVVLRRDNAGATVRLVFLDPAIGAVSIVKMALERQPNGVWTASDGVVRFGDPVKYLITTRTDGARVYRDVHVTDFIPGYDPADHKSTTDATYVPGSAACQGDCAVSFDEDSQQLTWALGDLRGAERTMVFVVRMPPLPADPVFNEDGELIETVVNVAEMSWRERTSLSTQRLASALVTRGMRSNEVVTTMAERPEVLHTPPAVQPPPGKKPPQGLPETGAPANSDPIMSVAGLCLLLGVWLMLVSRRRGFLPQR